MNEHQTINKSKTKKMFPIPNSQNPKRIARPNWVNWALKYYIVQYHYRLWTWSGSILEVSTWFNPSQIQIRFMNSGSILIRKYLTRALISMGSLTKFADSHWGNGSSMLPNRWDNWCTLCWEAHWWLSMTECQYIAKICTRLIGNRLETAFGFIIEPSAQYKISFKWNYEK